MPGLKKLKRPTHNYEYHMLKASEGGTSKSSVKEWMAPVPVSFGYSPYVGHFTVVIPGEWNSAAARKMLHQLG